MSTPPHKSSSLWLQTVVAPAAPKRCPLLFTRPPLWVADGGGAGRRRRRAALRPRRRGAQAHGASMRCLHSPCSKYMLPPTVVAPIIRADHLSGAAVPPQAALGAVDWLLAKLGPSAAGACKAHSPRIKPPDAWPQSPRILIARQPKAHSPRRKHGLSY